ncbi:MAG: hypothetical protein IPG96_16495 [Proteobacteria bacterium]|nr:hypothetical protein [Pseudomonadota bacterium]
MSRAAWLAPHKSGLVAAVVLCLVATGAPAQSWDPEGVYVRAPLGPRKPDAASRPISLSAENGGSLFNGTYRYGIALDVPPARNDLKPSLALSYDSDRGDGPLGEGWAIALDEIRRSSRRGVPRYIGPGLGLADQDELTFRLGDHGGELVLLSSTSAGLLFRPRREGSFAKFYYRAATDDWMVQQPDGRTVYLGGANARDAEACTGPTHTWHVRRVVDPDGNAIDYGYVCAGGIARPERIEYDKHLVAGGPPYRPRVVFTWNGNGNASQVDYRRGYRVEPDLFNLVEIYVGGFGEDGTSYERKHALSWGRDPSRPAATVLQVFRPHALPLTAFSYGPSPSRFAASAETLPDPEPARSSPEQATLQRQGTCPYKLSSPIDFVTSTLVDVDGDGDLDQLYVRSAQTTDGDTTRSRDWCYRPPVAGDGWFVRRRSGAYWGVEERVSLPAACAFYDSGVARCRDDALSWSRGTKTSSTATLVEYTHETYQDVIDVDGDGRVDLVLAVAEAGQSKVYVCPWSGAGFGACEPWLTLPASAHACLRRSVTRTHLDKRVQSWTRTDLVDLDGDRVAEYLTADDSPNRSDVRVHRLSRATGAAPVASTMIQLPECSGVHWPIDTTCLRSSVGAMGGRGGMCSTRSLRDLNGDGLADLIDARVRAVSYGLPYRNGWHTWETQCVADGEPAVQVRYGRGAAGFSAGGLLYLSGTGPLEVTHKIQGEVDTSRIVLEGQSSLSALIDLNADGLPDLVRPACTGEPGLPWAELERRVLDWRCDPALRGRLRVRLNTGRGFGAEGYWELPVGSWASNADYLRQNQLMGVTLVGGEGEPSYKEGGLTYVNTLRSGMFDLDGDGQLEFVAADSPLDWRARPASSWNVVHVVRATPVDANLAPWGPGGKLEVVKADNGLTTRIAYERPTTGSVLPFAKWAPVSIEQDDATTLMRRRQTLSYAGGYYDLAERELAGFSVVQSSESGRSTTHAFAQDAIQRGAEFLTDVADERGVLRRASVAFEAFYFDDFRRSWSRPRWRQENTYGGGPALMRREDYTYVGQAANCQPGAGCQPPASSSIASLGLLENATHSSTRRDRTEYRVLHDDSSGRYLVRRARQLRIDVATGATLADQQWSYDAECSLGLPGTMSLGRVCKHVVQRGIGELPAVTAFRYDAVGRLERKELPDAESETLTYHGLTPYLSTRTNALGHVQHLRSYHGLTGQPGAVCGPRYATNASTDYCTLTTYDSYGRPLRKHYRALGLQRLLAEYAYQDGFAPSTPPWARVTEHPDYWGQFGGRAPARPRTTYFDAYGRVMQQVRQTAAGFSKDLFTYDALGRLAAAWRPWSGTSATIFEPPPGMRAPSYSYTHDALDRLVSVRHPDGAVDRTSYEGAWVKQEDAAGHLVWKLRNAHGEVIERHRYSGGRWFPPERFFYDAAGRLIEAADAEGGRYRYAYLWDGSLARAQLPSGTWEHSTTLGGKRQLTRAPDGGSVLTLYDWAGRVERRMTWDQTPGAASGSRCLVPQPQTTLLTYGGTSRPRDLGLLVSEDGGSYRRAWSYDELGGVATESLTDAASGQTLSINTSRTSLGEPETVRLSNGTTLVRSYDAAGQLVGLRSGDGQLDALLAYDTAGRAQGISAQVGGAGGVALGRVYEHDDRGLLRRQVTRAGSLGTVSDVSYAYAPDGNPTARVDAVRGDQSTWSYDGADRLDRRVDRHGGSGDTRWHLYAYNDNGALLKAIGDGTTTTYVYRDSTESVLAGMMHSRSTGAIATSYTSSSTGSRCSAGGRMRSGSRWPIATPGTLTGASPRWCAVARRRRRCASTTTLAGRCGAPATASAAPRCSSAMASRPASAVATA